MYMGVSFVGVEVQYMYTCMIHNTQFYENIYFLLYEDKNVPTACARHVFITLDHANSVARVIVFKVV